MKKKDDNSDQSWAKLTEYDKYNMLNISKLA